MKIMEIFVQDEAFFKKSGASDPVRVKARDLTPQNTFGAPGLGPWQTKTKHLVDHICIRLVAIIGQAQPHVIFFVA